MKVTVGPIISCGKKKFCSFGLRRPKEAEANSPDADLKSSPLSDKEVNKITVADRSVDRRPSSRSQDKTSNPVVNLRKREVILAKVSICIVCIFFVCHGIKIVPNSFEMVQTYVAVN